MAKTFYVFLTKQKNAFYAVLTLLGDFFVFSSNLRVPFGSPPDIYFFCYLGRIESPELSSPPCFRIHGGGLSVTQEIGEGPYFLSL